MGDQRERVVAAALARFAAKGYSATTIADIEAASGLTPGAGGTYRHFRSKREILDAVIDAALAQSDAILAPPPESLEGAARDAFAQLDQQRDLMALMLRDLDQFPDLQRKVIDRLLTGPIRVVAERTAAIAPQVDADALALLLVGALVNVKVIEMLSGRSQPRISQKRLVAAWAHLYRSAIAAASVA
jgi:AcrR family transcriptional regulator